jgi:hypothetical protein
MAYYTRSKFDDPVKSVSTAGKNVYDAFKDEAIRGALRAVSNRVLHGGYAGTATTTYHSLVGTGGTGGVTIRGPIIALINGRAGTVATASDLELPVGTQASATYVKYLISSGFGSSGTVTAGNEGTSSTAALLPDLPDGHVAIGYVEYAANGTRGFIRTNSVLSGNTGGTNGTVNAWVDLVCYPYNQA